VEKAEREEKAATRAEERQQWGRTEQERKGERHGWAGEAAERARREAAIKEEVEKRHQKEHDLAVQAAAQKTERHARDLQEMDERSRRADAELALSEQRLALAYQQQYLELNKVLSEGEFQRLKEWNDMPANKGYQEVMSAWAKIKTVSELPNRSVAGDEALIYTFAKLLDDRTGVRNEEHELFSHGGNLREQVARWGIWLRSGQVLPDNIYNEYINIARRLAVAQNKGFVRHAAQFAETSKNQGYRPENTVFDYRTDDMAALKPWDEIVGKPSPPRTLPQPLAQPPRGQTTTAPAPAQGAADAGKKVVTKAIIDETWKKSKEKYPTITREEIIRQLGLKPNYIIKDE
jgi:hypothetical protein